MLHGRYVYLNLCVMCLLLNRTAAFAGAAPPPRGGATSCLPPSRSHSKRDAPPRLMKRRPLHHLHHLLLHRGKWRSQVPPRSYRPHRARGRPAAAGPCSLGSMVIISPQDKKQEGKKRRIEKRSIVRLSSMVKVGNFVIKHLNPPTF